MALKIRNMAGHLIRRMNQISVSVFQDHMKRNGYNFTSVQFASLNLLSAHPNIDQATLAGLIAHDRATIGSVIDRLEQMGLVNRVVSQQDRRARVISLTPKGQTTLETLFPLVQNLQDDILGGLTETERTEFIRLATKIATTGNHLSRAPLAMPQSAKPAGDRD